MTSPDSSVVLRQARIVGRDDAPLTVVIRDGRIAWLGPDGHAPQPGVNTHSEVIDLDGRYLMPGIWDHHVHFTQWAKMRSRLDVSGAHTAAQVAQMVAARHEQDLLAHTGHVSTTLAGFGFRDALWPDIPTAEALDAVTPGRPVVLISGDLHSVWVNSAAQRHYRVPHAGLLREEEAFVIETQMAEETRDDRHQLTRTAAEDAAARGVVGIIDLEMEDNTVMWAQRMADGVRSLRVHAGFYKGMLDTMIERGQVTGEPVDGTDGLLTVGPLKVISDGSLNTRTAYCHDPYPGTADYGMNNVPPAELEAFVAPATLHGFDVAIHAIGDLANTLALDMFAATGARGSIEHAQLVRPEDLPRFAQLGVIASIQPEHAMDDRDVADAVWAGRTDRAFAFGSLARAGATLRLGSDAPVAPLDPWITFAAAIERSKDGRAPWHPEQQLTRAVALDASTRGWGRDDAAVTEGAVADLVVCEADPMTAPAQELRTMPVAATMIAGRFTHRTV